MKHIVFSTVVLCAWSVSGAALAAEKKVTLAVENMTCVSCPYIVEGSLAALPGVKSVAVSFEAQRATVVFEDAITTVDVLIKATTDAGYPSQEIL